jgi:hypothetical protein
MYGHEPAWCDGRCGCGFLHCVFGCPWKLCLCGRLRLAPKGKESC